MLIDYLADAWDVVGPPEFDLPDCALAERWLSPGDPAGSAPDEPGLCRFCLEPLDPRADGSGFIVHDNRCPALALLRSSGNGAPPA